MANRTSLYPLHLELGAKMVQFAGYEMPLSYPSGIIREHRQVREGAGLFDVSHMGQIRVEGEDATQLLESLLPTDLAKLAVGRQRYSFLTLANGGILDDLMVSRFSDHYLLVVNAANKHTDYEHITEILGSQCSIELLDDRALLAVQGPQARAAIARLCPIIETLRFLDVSEVDISGFGCLAFCSGYTGEDGFEIALAVDDAPRLAQLLLDQAEVSPAGLGARDSLRLEAGLCLHGSDIHAGTTPVEAGLAWAIPTSRRAGGDKAGRFPGSERILDELEHGPKCSRVGIQPKNRAPVRAHAVIQTTTGDKVGEISSGGYGPSVNRPVAMGYVESHYKSIGTELEAIVRDKPVPVTVCELPFSQHRYQRN